jgi:glyceraldehyde-3-phosphate dehydrogenase (EC 1.2.1.12)
MTTRVAINGFGRIGRSFLRALLSQPGRGLEVVAVNDLTEPENLAYLLQFDSAYGRLPQTVSVVDGHLQVGSHKIRVLAERDPAQLPWKDLGVDLVIESTGLFTKREGAAKHLEAGAKKVIISAPAKGADLTVVMGVNDDQYDPERHHIISNASCTTNCLAPVAKVLNDNFGIRRGMMTTVHSYTMDQNLQDNVHKDLRRARAAAMNIVPTTTGAARAVALVIPELKGKFDGFAVRVPTPTVSMIDFVVELERTVSVDEVNETFREAAQSKELEGILEVTDEELVSSDFIGSTASAIVDLPLTMALGGNLIKVIAWYDNEWGYATRVADLTAFIADEMEV